MMTCAMKQNICDGNDLLFDDQDGSHVTQISNLLSLITQVGKRDRLGKI